MKPSVGRVVHYVGLYHPEECRAAIITETKPQGIGICIFAESGVHFINTNLPEDQETKKPGSWHWPERVE
jgi:hypothetical protein